MKLLIAGAGTPTGKELVTLLKRRGIQFDLLPDSLLQNNDRAGLESLVTRLRPDQTINLHSYRANSQVAVTKAQNSEHQCRLVNFQYAQVLATLCGKLDIPLLHLSSAYVFDGEKKLGYTEQDEPAPLGIFGQSNLKAEQAVSALPRHIILRTGWLFGKNQCDVIKSWIRSCKKKDGVIGVARRRFSPTANQDLARVILAICYQVDCDANVWGVYHYCGLETKKESEFVQQILKYASLHDEEIYQMLDNIKVTEKQPVSPELSNTTLSSKKLSDTFGIKQRSWHGVLQTTIKSMYQGAAKAEKTSVAERKITLPDNLSSKSFH